MIITDAIEHATAEQEICLLLEAYLESLQFCDPENVLPCAVKQLPVAGAQDVACRRRMLLDIRVPPRNERQQELAREAREVSDTAARRLQALTVNHYQAAA